MGASCIFLSAQNMNNATAAGSWKGTFADSIGSGTLTVNFKQAGNGDVSGTYETDSGGSGVVSGDIHSGTLEFILTQKTPNCLGSYTGKLTVNGSSASGTYWGSDCNGKHSNGVISLTLENSEASVASQATNSPERGTKEGYQVCEPMDHTPVDIYPSIEVANTSIYSTNVHVIARVPCGEKVRVLSQSGIWRKVRTSDGTVGYVLNAWVRKGADKLFVTAQSETSQSTRRSGIPPDTLRAIAWRAIPWTTTTYYQQSGTSSTDCTGSGSWLGLLWNGSASCTSVYTPTQNIPVNWYHYTIYELVDTTNNWMVLSCTRNWAFSQCRYLVPGESFPYEVLKGQAWVIGQKRVKFNIVAVQPKNGH